MISHDVKIRVRYSETDQMGYMYYGNYCSYYEVGRAETIRSLGISYKELEEDHKIMMPVLKVESKFLKPALYDELITVRSILKELPTKLIEFHHELFNEREELIHKGNVKLFFIDMKTGKRVSTPAYVIDKMVGYF